MIIVGKIVGKIFIKLNYKMKVTTIWWWTGTYNVLSALKNIDWLKISAIVSMSDDGWSTWRLRDEYWMLPSWDIRRAVVALSDQDKNGILRELFNYRFKWWGLAWHNLWNLIMLALEELSDNYWKAIDYLEEIFNIKWKIYPVSFEKTRLLAKLEDWQFILWETNIDIPKHDWNIKIDRLYVIKEEYAKVVSKLSEWDIWINPDIINKILEKFLEDLPLNNPILDNVLWNSDYIIVGPGDLYTSILPNLLLWNVAENLVNSNAKKILIMNLFNKYWETSWYKLYDFLTEYKKYLWKDIFDYILVQDRENFPISQDLLDKYKFEKKEIIQNNINDSRIIKWDFVKQFDMARHDPKKIKIVLEKILK